MAVPIALVECVHRHPQPISCLWAGRRAAVTAVNALPHVASIPIEVVLDISSQLDQSIASVFFQSETDSG